MTTNAYVPGNVTNAPVGRSVPDYNGTILERIAAGKPSTARSLRQLAYERAGEDVTASNPQFNFAASGLVGTSMTASAEPRILRGYIRRSNASDGNDPTSKYRLYFMFNPATLDRQFVSYLDQQALDPFNTIFGSNNLVAPPGILDFSFEMFFDRQIEVAQDANHPGVKVDYDYFDRVIRGVEPTGGSEMQDNGVFLINPRNIKVVFSPLLVLEGRAYSADTTFEKFSHRMTPTRVRINLTMRVQYVGPDTNTFSMLNVSDAGVAQATVPYDESISVRTTYTDVAGIENVSLENDLSLAQSFLSRAAGVVSTAAGVIGGGISGLIPGNGNGGFIFPCKGQVSQEFGGPGGHPGMDIFNQLGTPIYAVMDGTVKATQPDGPTFPASGGYGNIVRIEHTPDLGTGYGHLIALDVADGTHVTQGQQIGRMGNTGKSTGSHLHFEVYHGPTVLGGANFTNPREYLPSGAWPT